MHIRDSLNRGSGIVPVVSDLLHIDQRKVLINVVYGCIFQRIEIAVLSRQAIDVYIQPAAIQDLFELNAEILFFSGLCRKGKSSAGGLVRIGLQVVQMIIDNTVGAVINLRRIDLRIAGRMANKAETQENNEFTIG